MRLGCCLPGLMGMAFLHSHVSGCHLKHPTCCAPLQSFAIELNAPTTCRSESIAQAMVARGFQGPEGHTFYMTKINRTSWVANIMALMLLGTFMVTATHYK